MYQLEAIGHVENRFEQPADHHDISAGESRIVVKPEYQDGLLRITDNKYLQVVFFFDQSEPYSLLTTVYSGETKGVFASRSPRRPSRIGTTTVELLSVAGNVLLVKGLDAINNTPVLDIKPFARLFDTEQLEENERTVLRHSPRKRIHSWLHHGNLESLLLEAGQLHGHYCPGLAMGILASVYCIRKLREHRTEVSDDGMEELLALTETNSCFADGIQFATGCTFGNNSLIYQDTGKTAVTLIKRATESRAKFAVRACAKPGFRDHLDTLSPDFSRLFSTVVKEKNHDPTLVNAFKQTAMDLSFAMVDRDCSALFELVEVNPALPQYAPIRESELCSSCGESVMGSKVSHIDGEPFCYACSKHPIYQLDGAGISVIESRD